ncbi:hypothetical protein ABZ484_12940 [Streptomyces sp. NPDC006393]|uniref:hypothetical protein n=1 Tax=Streptomyces sp. NPDC006393 TaxID=3156763 RepID=UPI0033FCA36D
MHFGGFEAVEQVIEVRRIAQEAQRRVRAVLRDCRGPGLGTELVGTQGTLSAAGLHCEVRGQADGLDGGVRSALGWVVREAMTSTSSGARSPRRSPWRTTW